MQDILQLVSIIRDFINTRRKQHILVQLRPDWNRLTSSLDVIGDTEMAFDAYLDHLHNPATYGELYILLYGVLRRYLFNRMRFKT